MYPTHVSSDTEYSGGLDTFIVAPIRKLIRYNKYCVESDNPRWPATQQNSRQRENHCTFSAIVTENATWSVSGSGQSTKPRARAHAHPDNNAKIAVCTRVSTHFIDQLLLLTNRIVTCPLTQSHNHDTENIVASRINANT